jgi:hypothetical protein
MPYFAVCASIAVEVRRMKPKWPHIVELSALLLFTLVGASAQARAAKPDVSKVKQTAKPVLTLAMDGPRVAYMLDSRRVGVWNLVTGATTLVKGNYPSNGHNFGFGTGEVAIAGKRVALITRFAIGNTLQTQERLFTASLGGSAHQIGKKTNHASSSGDCTVPGTGTADGNWVGGLVGAGNVLAVSSWKASNAATTGERLNLVVPTGLRPIASGPGAIVSQSTNGGHIAVLRSTDAWPAYQGPLEQSAPMVGIFSSSGVLLAEVALPPLPDYCGGPYSLVRIALSGNQLVALRLDIPQAGSLTSTIDVYNWKTGALVRAWPLALPHGSPGANRLAVSGRVAVIQGSNKLRLLDLTNGRETTVAASRPNGPATIGSRGLVYALNPSKDNKPGKLVFVPTTRLLAALSQ